MENSKKEENQQEKFYGLKYDIVFKKMFVENNDLLKQFISDMLDIPFEEIGEVTVENPDLLPDEVDGKYSRLDIRANIRNKIINIEIQVANTKGFDKRAMYYWAGIYHEQLKAGKSYDTLKKTISMNVLAYSQFENRNDYHSKYVLYDIEHEHELPEILELHFFELPKAVKEQQEDRKHLWLKLINAESKDDLNNLAKDRNEDFLQKGVQAVNNMNANTDFKTIVRMREEAMHEKAYWEEGIRQEGIEQGRAEGEVKGILNALIGLVKDGLLPISVASERAGMTIEDFEKELAKQ